LNLQNEELRKAQVELALSRDRYTDLYEFAPIAYVTLDKRGIILEGNLMAGKLLGVERRSLWRTDLAKFITGPSQDDWYLHRRAAFSEDGIQQCELEIRRADGIQLSVRAESIGSGSGSERHCCTALLDVTEKKRAAAEREELLAREQAARREAESATKAKDRFLATVSHELRTPLTPILGWSRLLREKRANAVDTTHALESIERNARMQAQLIDDLLDLSGSIAGKIRLSIQPVDLPGVISAAIDTIRSGADAKALKIDTEFDEDARLVAGDTRRLQQVFWNLLSNAVKFTPPGGRIGVQTHHIRSGIQIVVKDTGKGIPAEFLPYAFEAFSQAENSSVRTYGGLGLGLAIVRQIVELHRGSVRVSSKEGEGTTFTIQLPIGNARNGDRLPEAISAGGLQPRMKENPTFAGFTGLHMLVVDDEADTLEMLRTVLVNTHAEVKACANAGEALEAFEAGKTDVLISDLDMPNLDGYTLIARVRDLEQQQGGHIIAIALTAHVQAEDRERAFALGFDGFLPKPVVPDELLSTLHDRLQN
jgi:PAS domain S-box-containing protein